MKFMRVPVVGIVLLTLVLSGSAAQAMTIIQFDKMSDDDQNEYVADLVVGAEHVLTGAGHPEQAAQVHKLFTDIKPGDKISDGMADFAILLAKARVADDLRVQKEPNARRLEVEDAMALTLRKNGIEMPDSFFTVNANFRPKLPPKR
jgi:hypothetical protein